MREDLRRVAQRALDQNGGKLSIRQLHKRYQGRIPGTVGSYGYTIGYLIAHALLQFNRKR